MPPKKPTPPQGPRKQGPRRGLYVKTEKGKRYVRPRRSPNRRKTVKGRLPEGFEHISNRLLLPPLRKLTKKEQKRQTKALSRMTATRSKKGGNKYRRSRRIK